MNFDELAYNPRNPYESVGQRHNQVLRTVFAENGQQIHDITDKRQKEEFIIDSCIRVGRRLFGQFGDPRGVLGAVPGFNGLFSEVDVPGQYQQLFPAVMPEAAARKILDILGPLTTVPVETDDDLANFLASVKRQEDELVYDPAANQLVLTCTSVLRNSLVCWYAPVNPIPMSGARIKTDVAIADVLGAAIGGGPTFGLAALEGAVAASGIWSMIAY